MIPWLVALALQTAPAGANLRGLSAVDTTAVWASGHRGTFIRVVDGKQTAAVVPGAENLDFRDVHGFSRDVAVLMSAGPGDASRVYRTADGGAHWSTVLRNPGPDGFYDCMAFWDSRRGLLLGDPVNGRFVVMATEDGGATWTRAPVAGMPPARPGEGAFAASGTCIATGPGGRAWFGTGGEHGGRVFRTEDSGATWSAVDTPIRHDSAGAGIFSIAFRDALHGVAVGGDYGKPADDRDNAIVTEDGGKTWRLATGHRPHGYREGVAWIDVGTMLAIGPNGADLSSDGGLSWKSLDWPGAHAVAISPSGRVWTAGANAAVRQFEVPKR